MNRSLRLAVAALFLSCGAVRAADDLEKRLLEQSPHIITALREAGCENVGVLKFQVKKGNNPASNRVGTLNQRLSDKLELALVLKNDPNRREQQLDVLRNPNKIVATIPGADHLTAEGRKRLFTKEYPLSWGKSLVTPDVFLMGSAEIAADLKTMDIYLQAFSRANPATPVEICKLEKVRLDLEDLLDAGESFTTRGLFDGGKTQLTAEQRKDQATATAVQTALVTKPATTIEPTTLTTPSANSAGHPLSPDSNSPIFLKVFYDNQPQPIQFQGGVAFVAEPRQGQTVRYEVHRKGTDHKRLGVVFKVNGDNTLFKQRMSDEQCTPWVMEANKPAFSVTGYRLPGDKEEVFTVLSQGESKSREAEYGEYVGMISVSVFPEKPAELAKADRVKKEAEAAARLKAELERKPLEAEGDDFAILNRAEFPANPGANLKDLKNTLGMLKDRVATRGLVVPGQKNDRTLERVPFEPDSLPIVSATIRYYNASDLPK